MRHTTNKHYDTNGGLLGHPTYVSSHPKPPVSKEDETMKQTERKVGDVIYIDVDKSAKIYAIGSDGNDVRYYYTYEGVRNFIYEKQSNLLEELHSNLIASAPEMLKVLKAVNKYNWDCNQGRLDDHHKKTMRFGGLWNLVETTLKKLNAYETYPEVEGGE